MSGYILCHVKKAELPYYIENVSMNIYTIEELCFYIYHNIYLLDDTIIGEPLCDWLRNELGLERLYYRLYRILEAQESMGNFILPIFKEISYLTHQEFKELNRQLAQLEEQPPVVRQKKKGDYLMNNRMYVNALKVYEKALTLVEGTNFGGQFVGEICHNMGCAYMNLFQLEEGCRCFLDANERLRTKASLKHYLYAFFLTNGNKDWEQECIKCKVDNATKEEILTEIKASKKEDVPKQETKQALVRIVKEYHRSTGF